MFKELIDEFYRQVQKHAPDGVTVHPGDLEPATEADIAESEERLGMEFTDELREWYLTTNRQRLLGRPFTKIPHKHFSAPKDMFLANWELLLPEHNEIVSYDQLFPLSMDEYQAQNMIHYVLAGERRGQIVRLIVPWAQPETERGQNAFEHFPSLQAWLHFLIELARRGGYTDFGPTGEMGFPVLSKPPDVLVQLQQEHGLKPYWYF